MSERGGAVVERILVVAAHPDDVDFGVAGSVAIWTTDGVDVAYCIVTDGDAGGFDEGVPRHEMATIRRSEQEAAAKVVGVDELHWLGYPDGRVEPSLDLRRDLSRVIRQVRPDRVVCPSPQRLFESVYASHPDHLATGEAAICAVYPDSRNPFAHPELLAEGHQPWTVPEVWIMHGPQPNTFVDITDAIDRKIAALLCHVSQMTEPDAMDERMRAWGAANAQLGGLPMGRMAEAFQRVATA
jgi:LmbE family N-acetylglucosaminyl deacetylase